MYLRHPTIIHSPRWCYCTPTLCALAKGLYLLAYELFKFWGFRDDGLRGAGFRLHDYISSDMEFAVEGSRAVACGEAQRQVVVYRVSAYQYARHS